MKTASAFLPRSWCPAIRAFIITKNLCILLGTKVLCILVLGGLNHLLGHGALMMEGAPEP